MQSLQQQRGGGICRGGGCAAGEGEGEVAGKDRVGSEDWRCDWCVLGGGGKEAGKAESNWALDIH